MPDFITPTVVTQKTLSEIEVIELTNDQLIGKVAANASSGATTIEYDLGDEDVEIGWLILFGNQNTYYTVTDVDDVNDTADISPALNVDILKDESIQVVQSINTSVFNDIADGVENEMYSHLRTRYALPFTAPYDGYLLQLGAEGWRLHAMRKRGLLTEEHPSFQAWIANLKALGAGKQLLGSVAQASATRVSQIDVEGIQNFTLENQDKYL